MTQEAEVTYRTIQVSYTGPIATVALNKPETLNAITSEMLNEIEHAYRQIDLKEDIRVIILQGEGRSFCSGANRNNPPGMAPAGSSPDAEIHVAREGERAAQAIANANAVTIARIHGHVIGGGLVLATSCDFRIASTDAVLRLPEVSLGIPLTWGMVPLLIQEIGSSAARQLVMLGDPISAENALRLGLLHDLVAPEQLDTSVERWTQKILSQPNDSLQMSKHQFRTYRHETSEQQLNLEAGMYRAAMQKNWIPL